jgi:CO dehydrogenase/acetyl-CoA synthase gamma subunit (corrinoid Fe-S protein)
MVLDEQYSEELRALRNLERTVRAYGVTAQMLSPQRRQEMLAAALREVVEARKTAIRRSRRAVPKQDV